ncbi:hypothetical protein MPLB_1490075 [Mesorhizobium sp. ORS 3324]|nr:hypothetical protein MPLB_1490075 [Mesorhizobium sp. ORS 3324]
MPITHFGDERCLYRLLFFSIYATHGTWFMQKERGAWPDHCFLRRYIALNAVVRSLGTISEWIDAGLEP